MKLTWLLAFKVFIVLFWIGNLLLLIIAGLESRRGIMYLFLNDFMFDFFFIIGICGAFSLMLEKFYENIMFKYFILSFLLVSCYFFLFITLQFVGVAKSSLKGIYLSLNGLLIHYCINFIFFCLSVFGIYSLFRNNTKFLYICFLCTLLYLFMYVFFYGAIIRDSPI